MPVGDAWNTWIHHCVLFCFLLMATVCDLDYREIPFGITIPGTIVGLIFSMIFPWPWPVGLITAYASIQPGVPWWSEINQIGEGLYPWPFWGPLPPGFHPGFNVQTGWRRRDRSGCRLAMVGAFASFSARAGHGSHGPAMDLMMMAGSFRWQAWPLIWRIHRPDLRHPANGDATTCRPSVHPGWARWSLSGLALDWAARAIPVLSFRVAPATVDGFFDDNGCYVLRLLYLMPPEPPLSRSNRLDHDRRLRHGKPAACKRLRENLRRAFARPEDTNPHKVVLPVSAPRRRYRAARSPTAGPIKSWGGRQAIPGHLPGTANALTTGYEDGEQRA